MRLKQNSIMAQILKDKTNSLDFVYDFYLKMKKNKINLAYEGEITHQITKAFTSLTENNMIKDEDYNSVQKKVFHVMVECLQNISKHSENRYNLISSKDGRGIFTSKNFFSSILCLPVVPLLELCANC